MANLIKQYRDLIARNLKYIPMPQFVYSVNISLQYKYLYAETPKVACSTIKTTLQRLELDDPNFSRKDFEDIHKRDFSPLLKVKQVPDLESFLKREDIFKFCFVRNPYNRVLSAYLDKIMGNQSQKKQILIALGHDGNALHTHISFKEFIHVIADLDIQVMDPHWRVQYDQTFQDWIKYDFIGKFENFEKDFAYVGNKISSNFNQFLSSEKRHSTNANKHIDEYYTTELKEFVYKIYKKDFEYFGYDK